MTKIKKEAAKFTWSQLPRCRWNVVDLITIVARPTVPAYLFCEINMQAAEALKKRLDASGAKITVTAMLLKAISIAQLWHPQSRSIKLPWGKRITFPRPIAGFTVERLIGLQPAVFFGVLHDAHLKPLAQVAHELKAYSTNEISQVPQLQRESLARHAPWLLRQFALWLAIRIPAVRQIVNPATFGLSTLGKFGLRTLMGPCVSTCIFGVGSAELRAVAIDGAVQIQPMMTLSLSVDTHVLDMYSAARLLADIKTIVESGLAGHLDEPSCASRETTMAALR